MNDPAAARTEPARPRQERERHPQQAGPKRRAKIAVLVRAALIATGLVIVYYVLPLDGRGTSSGTSVLLACGLLLVVLVFWWEVQAIAHSPFPG
ncbi:hypothetical protein [Streptomyces sp. CA-179760]|uniref:hypothetical protein n=1 Tax=Streptomyces sp. CA-179760 TaxID=3240054 RepID=UPI003D8F844A